MANTTLMAERERGQSADSARPRTGGAYCPHCHLLVAEEVGDQPWPLRPERCTHCRLLIGPGRCAETPDADPGARGTAAGLVAQRAKHSDTDPNDVSRHEILNAIRSVAEELGSRPERLLMIDYQQRAIEDEGLPSLDDVFAAFGNWKHARRQAA